MLSVKSVTKRDLSVIYPAEVCQASPTHLKIANGFRAEGFGEGVGRYFGPVVARERPPTTL